MKFLKKIFGDYNQKYLNKIRPLVKEINSFEKDFEHLSREELIEETNKIRAEISKGKNWQEKENIMANFLPKAFAICREAAKRTLKQRHYDVQLLAGIALHQGKIAEMKTGEGKTLAATLPIFLNALSGAGVHIVTVNDYLSRRDTVWMGQIYNYLGLSVACLNNSQTFIYDPEYKKPDEEKDKIRDELGGFMVVEDYLRPCQKKEAYEADITYGTNNEFGFDYLRDNMSLKKEEQSQRGFNFAIIDEIDSILIDEARTPLIISQPDSTASNMYKDFSRIVPQLKENTDYNVDEKLKTATLTEDGIAKIEKILGIDNIYQEKGMKYLHYLEQSLRAKVFFHRDKDYIVKNGEVIIVDEFTGRLLPGRRYSGGLHQAIEAKEGVEIKPESKTLATITFQNYFRMYRKLAGMTGTAATSSEEFQQVYNLEVILIPTNKPVIRNDLPDKIYKTEQGKFRAIIEEVKKRHKMGQPVLLGTTSIEKNELLAKLLKREGIDSQILNAKNHQKEGEIIAQAGRFGQVTVATNMAGRGVDIILGGNPPDKEEAEKIKKIGGLCVIGSQRHEARRIDNQLRGRAGRQGDPGVSIFFVSLEDDLLRIFGGDRIKRIMNVMKIPEDQPIEAKVISGAIEKAQEKIEGMNFDLRKHVLEYDNVIAKHRNKIYHMRNEILNKNYRQLKEYIKEIISENIEEIVFSHQSYDKFDYEEIFEEIKTIFPVADEVHFGMMEMTEPEQIISYLESVFRNYFEEKEKKEGEKAMEEIISFVSLRTIDSLWSEHLDMMEYLKDSVNLRAYGGRDPLVEYKTEGHKLFRGLEESIKRQISRTVFKITTV